VKLLRELINRFLPSAIGRQAILVVIGNSINFASNFLIAMILARIIPVEEMGTYRQVMYLTPLAFSIGEMGLGATIYRYWRAYDPESRLRYVRMCVVSSFVLGTAASLILVVLAFPLPALYNNPQLKLALLVSAPYALASTPLMLIRPALISQGQALKATTLETLFSLVSILSILFAFLAGLSLAQALAVWSVACILRLVFIPIIFGRYLTKGGVWWDGKIFREVWSYLWPLQVARWPDYFVTYVDKFVASIFMTTTEFASYSLGARQIPFLGTIGGAVSSVLVPNLVEDFQAQRYDQICRRWKIAWERAAMATYLVAAFCMWYATPVIQLLFSAQYTAGAVPFRMFAMISFMIAFDYGSLARVFGRSDLIMRSIMIGAVIVGIIMVPLTLLFRAAGLALAVSLADYFFAAYLLWHYRTMISRPLFDFFPLPRLLVILGVAFASTAISSIFARSMAWENLRFLELALRLGVLFAIAVVFYLGFLTLLGLLNLGSLLKLMKRS
jgi:O-antigen/teichoic acid export membrane protein